MKGATKVKGRGSDPIEAAAAAGGRATARGTLRMLGENAPNPDLPLQTLNPRARAHFQMRTMLQATECAAKLGSATEAPAAGRVLHSRRPEKKSGLRNEATQGLSASSQRPPQ